MSTAWSVRGLVSAMVLTLALLSQRPAGAQAKKAAPAEKAEAEGAAGASGETRDPKEKQVESVLRSITWEKGPAKSAVGEQGELVVPEGYVFTGGPGTRKMLELMQNPTSGTELGLFAPTDLSWFLIFEFRDIGYVKDADKEKLNNDDILGSIRKGTEESNKQRQARGWPTITIVGWHTAPFFDQATKNLQWCIKGSSEGHDIVNYNTRLLGRHGVMEANLLVSPAKLDTTLPTVKNLLASFSFKDGKRYAEYKKGDRIAEYGLAALVVGGAAAAAAKLGLFGKLLAMMGKLWKLLIVGLVALGAGLKSLFSRRRKTNVSTPSAPPPEEGGGG